MTLVDNLLGMLHGSKHLVAGNNDDAVVTGCNGWRSLQLYAELVIDGIRLVLCHYPFRTWRDMGKGAINLHGHSHGRLKPQPRQYDVGVDVWDFRPVRLEEVLASTKSTRPLRVTDGAASSTTEATPATGSRLSSNCHS